MGIVTICIVSPYSSKVVFVGCYVMSVEFMLSNVPHVEIVNPGLDICLITFVTSHVWCM